MAKKIKNITQFFRLGKHIDNLVLRNVKDKKIKKALKEYYSNGKPKKEVVVIGNSTADFTVPMNIGVDYGIIYTSDTVSIPFKNISKLVSLIVNKAIGGGPCGNAVCGIRQEDKTVYFVTSVSKMTYDLQRNELLQVSFKNSEKYLHMLKNNSFKVAIVFPNNGLRAILTLNIKPVENTKTTSENKDIQNFIVSIDLNGTDIKVENDYLVMPADAKQNVDGILTDIETQPNNTSEQTETRLTLKVNNNQNIIIDLRDKLSNISDENNETIETLLKKLPKQIDYILVDGRNADIAEKIIKAHLEAKVVIDAGRVTKVGNEKYVDKDTHKLCSLNDNSDIVCCREYAEAVAYEINKSELKFTFNEDGEIDWKTAQKIYDSMEQKYNGSLDRNIIITLGSHGVLFRANDCLFYLPSRKSKQQIDSNGAGDAFHGAYLYALKLGFSFGDAVIYASIVGSLSVEYVGGRPRENLYKDAMKIFLNEHQHYSSSLQYRQIKQKHLKLEA